MTFKPKSVAAKKQLAELQAVTQRYQNRLGDLDVRESKLKEKEESVQIGERQANIEGLRAMSHALDAMAHAIMAINKKA